MIATVLVTGNVLLSNSYNAMLAWINVHQVKVFPAERTTVIFPQLELSVNPSCVCVFTWILSLPISVKHSIETC